MNQAEKHLYNTYLIITKSSQNKPFTLRKNFENFEVTKDYPYIRKLNSFFGRFPQIDPLTYFEAPFKIYPDEEYFDLQFFTSQKAIKTYSLYMKQRQDQMPDSPEQLEFIKKTLKFIASYCNDNKIKFLDYIKHKPVATYAWMQHYKNHKVSIYTLFGFENFQSTINSIPTDECALLLGDINEIYKYMTRFHKSIDAKHLVTEGIKRISKII